MARIILLLFLFTNGYCMEMHETVERMVMVRTTGSDLQPAATGYIYKKEKDGPASVVKLGESEVMEHLSKIYEKPRAYIAPAPVVKGPFHEKEEDGLKDASHISEEYTIPVTEESEENDHIPGTVNEDYEQTFEGYGTNLGGKYKDFSDYLHGVGSFGHSIYHDHGGGEDYDTNKKHEYGDKGYKGYAKSHKYGKGDAGEYHTEKYESFSISGEGKHDKHYGDAKIFGKDYKDGHGYKGGDHKHEADNSKEEEIDGYHKVFDKDEVKKDHDFYDGDKHEGGFHTYDDADKYHGSDAGGYEKGESHKSEHHEDDNGKGGFIDKKYGDEHDANHSEEESKESSHQNDGDFGAKTGEYVGKSYGYEIKH